jgi:hypothetical protein
MKVTVNIDCTPDEARRFLGLPDVAPMQEALMKQLQDQMSANISAMDPETMMKTWLPAQVQNFDQIQKMFWSSLAKATGGASKSGK